MFIALDGSLRPRHLPSQVCSDDGNSAGERFGLTRWIAWSTCAETEAQAKDRTLRIHRKDSSLTLRMTWMALGRHGTHDLHHS
jgi:hypothetical protein